MGTVTGTLRHRVPVLQRRELMKPEKIWTLSYSATGNTDKTVDTIGTELAAKLGLPLERLSFTKPAEREKIGRASCRERV